MKIRIIRNCGIEGTFKVKRKREGCYVVEHNGIDCLVNPSWCEVVEEYKQCNNCYWNSEKEENRCNKSTVKRCIDNNYKWWAKIEETNKLEEKTIRILKDLNVIKLFKDDIITADFEIGEKYLLVKNGDFKGVCIHKDCFEYVGEKGVKKDIELPNEFYFKYHTDTHCKFKAILNTGDKYYKDMYRIYSSLSDEYYCSYSIDNAKHNIETKEWIIMDKPKTIEVQFKKESNEEIEELVEKLDKRFTVNKKVNKIISLTSMEGFKTYIAKDKFVSVVQYEQYSFITTVAIEGTFTVVEKAEDIIKMLEE